MFSVLCHFQAQGSQMVVPTFGGKPPEADVRIVIKDLDPKPKFHLGLPGSNTVAQVSEYMQATPYHVNLA